MTLHPPAAEKTSLERRVTPLGVALGSAPADALDRETGLSIRFIRGWKPDEARWRNTLDATQYPHLHVSIDASGYCHFCGLLAFPPQPVQNGADTHE